MVLHTTTVMHEYEVPPLPPPPLRTSRLFLATPGRGPTHRQKQKESHDFYEKKEDAVKKKSGNGIYLKISIMSLQDIDTSNKKQSPDTTRLRHPLAAMYRQNNMYEYAQAQACCILCLLRVTAPAYLVARVSNRRFRHRRQCGAIHTLWHNDKITVSRTAVSKP